MSTTANQANRDVANRDVFVIAGDQTDFARNYSREELGIDAMFNDVVTGTLAAAKVDPSDIDAIHVGNAFGQLFTGQGQLGAMPATVVPELAGLPSARHEAACASGSIAILSAMSAIEAGWYDAILVVGAELQRNVAGDQAARNLGAAAWIGHEGEEATYMWPYMFDRLIDEYDQRYGIDYEHLAGIARINLDNGTRNPNAQTRTWKFDDHSFTEDDEANPVIEGRVRRQDCGQVTDGGAGVILASAAFIDRYRQRHGNKAAPIARIEGWGHRAAGLPMQPKLEASRNDEYVIPHVRRAITDAFDRAGIPGVEQLDAIETHDCFSMTEYMAIDHFGITKPGESYQAVEDGAIAFDGEIPVNPSGGLIGLGHPVGATGVRMLLDATKQVTGTAGDYQVPDAHRVATLNIGGSATTVVSLIVGRADREGNS